MELRKKKQEKKSVDSIKGADSVKRAVKKRLLVGGILLGGAALLSLLSNDFPGLAEWYSVTMYPVLVATVGRFFGMFPFSAVEIGLYVLVAAVLVTLIRAVVKTISGGSMTKAPQSEDDIFEAVEKAQQTSVKPLFYWFSGVFLTGSVLLFLYVANCGVNYQRLSFAEKAGFELKEYTAEDLQKVCFRLTEEVNQRVNLVERDENGVMVLEADERADSVIAMETLGEEYPCLRGYYPKPKRLQISEVLSYQNLSGIYLPFTIEANYNQDMTAYNIPFTACHELSHLRGFMQEEEANFIAFLACKNAARTDFQYSGYLLGWIYSMNALHRADETLWREVRDGLNEEVEADLQANNRFWEKYDGAVAEMSNKMNDTYLKANGQKDGVQSYGRMVDLIVVYYRAGVNKHACEAVNYR